MKLSVRFTLDIKILAAAAALAASVWAAYASYETIYKATPDYSFSLIVQAAREGDAASVDRLTDQPELARQFADALLRHRQSRPEAAQLLLLPAKASLVRTIQDAVSQEISPQANEEQLQEMQRMLSAAGRDAGLVLPAAGWQYESASWSRQDGSGYAVITTTWHNDALKASVPVFFIMERASAREWHIIGLADADSTIEALQKAGEAALAAANEPVSRQIDELITVSNLSASVVSDSANQAAYLRISYTPMLSAKGKETLQEASGIYELRRKDSALILSMPVRLALYADGKPHTSQFRLHASLPAQSELMQQPSLDGLQSRLLITSVTLKDGTRLVLKDELENI